MFIALDKGGAVAAGADRGRLRSHPAVFDGHGYNRGLRPAAVGARGYNRARRNTRAFTLLEIMLAVAILAMMAVAIYRFVQTNIVAMNASAAADAVDARYTGLRQMLAQQLQSLPQGTGALLGDAVKTNDRDRDVMTWIASAGPGVMTRYAPGDFKVDLRLRPHSAKSTQLDLGILRRPNDDEDAVESHETWVGLITDVTSLQIRYFDPRLNAWVQRWTDTITLPRLVRLVIGRRDAKVPEEMVVPLARTAL